MGQNAPRRDEQGLVIGAGIAGLAAARGLQSHGFKVTVLEGRDRIGGRIWTDRTLGTPIDLGASWIQGSKGNPITDLARQFKTITRETDWDNIRLHDRDGKRIPDKDASEIGSNFEDFQGQVTKLARNLKADISVGEGFRRALQGEKLTAAEQRALNWCLAALVVEAGAELEELSLLADDDEEFGGGDLLFPGGYDQIVQGLAKGLDIRLSHRVSKIEYGSKGVR